MTAVLLEDVYSNFRKQRPDPYGTKKEKVHVISENGQVLIVENKKGERYPVSINKVQILKT